MRVIRNGEPLIFEEHGHRKEKLIFLAGGFDSDWRGQVLKEFNTPSANVCFLDPGSDTDDLEKRTRWERDAIDICDVFALFLSPNGDHPLSIYELGKKLAQKNENSSNSSIIFVGFCEGYERTKELKEEMKADSIYCKAHTVCFADVNDVYDFIDYLEYYVYDCKW